MKRETQSLEELEMMEIEEQMDLSAELRGKIEAMFEEAKPDVVVRAAVVTHVVAQWLETFESPERRQWALDHLNIYITQTVEGLTPVHKHQMAITKEDMREMTAQDRERLSLLPEHKVVDITPNMGRTHTLGPKCWCQPRITFVEPITEDSGGAVLLHNTEHQMTKEEVSAKRAWTVNALPVPGAQPPSNPIPDSEEFEFDPNYFDLT